MCLQLCRSFELSLTFLTLVNVHMILLDMDLSLNKALETLGTKITSLPGGHFGPIRRKGWERLSLRLILMRIKKTLNEMENSHLPRV